MDIWVLSTCIQSVNPTILVIKMFQSLKSRQIFFNTGLILAMLVFCTCASEKVEEKEPPAPEPKPISRTVAAMEPIDIKGVEYQTLQVGEYVWLARDVSMELPDSWCYENKAANCEAGRLYTLESAQQACASIGREWRLPSSREWIALAQVFGGYYNYDSGESFGKPMTANRALKKTGEGSFNGRLGGWRGSTGGFDSQGKQGFYWARDAYDEVKGFSMGLFPDGGRPTIRPANFGMGFSCRCLRDVRN